jgi:hypothetical protein
MKIAGFLFLLFGLMSLGLGIAMLLDKTLLNQFGETIRIIFIVLLFVYGIYRVWTAVRTMKMPFKTTAR